MARVAKRTRRRMVCRIIVGRQRFSGVVLDLSASGMFVQTTARPRPRDLVSVELSVQGQREPIRLEAQVARLYMVPAQLVAVAQGGVGLRLTNAPEAFFEMLRGLQGASALGEPERGGAGLEAPGEPRRRYRVRMTQLGRARTRTLPVLAGSAEEAASLALAEAGDGWKVLESSEDEGPTARG